MASLNTLGVFWSSNKSSVWFHFEIKTPVRSGSLTLPWLVSAHSDLLPSLTTLRSWRRSRLNHQRLMKCKDLCEDLLVLEGQFVMGSVLAWPFKCVTDRADPCWYKLMSCVTQFLFSVAILGLHAEKSIRLRLLGNAAAYGAWIISVNLFFFFFLGHSLHHAFQPFWNVIQCGQMTGWHSLTDIFYLFFYFL